MTQIKLRRDTSAAFASSNPILGNGEPAYETDTKKLKIGDGTTAYTQLEYFSSGGGGSNLRYPVEVSDKSLMPSWYVVYNDGWCEQGGYNSSTSATINLLKQYTDTNYIVMTTILATQPNGNYYATKVSDKTTSNFVMTGNEIGSMWQASGYIS